MVTFDLRKTLRFKGSMQLALASSFTPGLAFPNTLNSTAAYSLSACTQYR
jgi:hypothetical protein